MNIKKPIMRLDIVSRTMQDVTKLIRICITNDHKVVIDLKSNINGRGAYILKDMASIQIAKKRNLLAKALRCNVDEEVYEQLLELIKN